MYDNELYFLHKIIAPADFEKPPSNKVYQLFIVKVLEETIKEDGEFEIVEVNLSHFYDIGDKKN